MNEIRIKFAELAWDETSPGVRFKAVTRDGRKLRLVEFSSEFVEVDWCRKRHAGYVLDGELEIAFVDRTERFTMGDGIIIAGGEAERHKAKVIGDTATLIFVEDPDP